MTVMIDDMRMPATVGSIRGRWSHLFTDNWDDLTELHVLAKSIGLRRSWFQHPECVDTTPWLCHYDVTDSKRAAAIRAGAVQVEYGGDHNLGLLDRIRVWREKRGLE